MNIPVRILIADSDVEFAVDLQEFLDQYDDLTVVQLTRDGVGTVNACRDMLPHVALIDLHLPVLDTVRAIETILATNPRVKILTLASQPADRYAVEAIKAGASGCLEKHIEKSAIVQAVREVVDGEVLLNPALAFSILQEFHDLYADKS